jgi:hypothetical protein
VITTIGHEDCRFVAVDISVFPDKVRDLVVEFHAISSVASVNSFIELGKFEQIMVTLGQVEMIAAR